MRKNRRRFNNRKNRKRISRRKGKYIPKYQPSRGGIRL